MQCLENMCVCDYDNCYDCDFYVTHDCYERCESENCEGCDGAGHCIFCEDELFMQCCDGECYDNLLQGCCNGQVYDLITQCCVGGTVQPRCGLQCCSSDEKCCDGSCCNKVWTKQTIGSSIEPCSDCEYIPGQHMCDGTTTELESYEKCLNVGVGQGGEHCDCHQSMQVVGYTYQCMIHYDVGKMAWCLLQGTWCAAECYFLRDPVGCANCLAGVDCCGGPCEQCDFVLECKKDPFSYGVEVKRLVFLSFGC